MNKITLIVSLFLLIGCAASKKESTIDLSKYDVNNTLTDFEREHAKATIYITTDPSSADVFMDGKYVGKANKDVVYIIPGNREITLIKEELYFQKKIYFKEGSNQPLDVKLIPLK